VEIRLLLNGCRKFQPLPQIKDRINRMDRIRRLPFHPVNPVHPVKTFYVFAFVVPQLKRSGIFVVHESEMTKAPSGAEYAAPDGARDDLNCPDYKDTAPTALREISKEFHQGTWTIR
jgi:hypothetical protein